MKHLPLISLFALLAALGCKDQVAEQEAQVRAKMAAKKDPGYVRVVNMSEKTLEVMSKGRRLFADVGPTSNSKLVPVGVGKQTVNITVDGVESKVEVDLVSLEGTTIFYTDSGPFVISGQPRRPTDEHNVELKFITAKGESATASGKLSAKVRSRDTDLDASVANHLLPAGRLELTGPMLTKSGRVEIEANCMYTFFFVQQPNGKFAPYLLLNTPNEKPVAGGMGG